MTDFHNPYNFVPTPPRNQVPKDSFLGDGEPIPQDRLHKDHFTGRLEVELEVKTPLLIPDAHGDTYTLDRNGHQSFPLRVGAEGRPELPTTSVKGMLRSAYEIITNSRYAIFAQDQQNRLGYRMDARDGLKLVPARIEEVEGELKIVLYRGLSEIGRNGSPEKQEGRRWQNEPMYAAWLPRYRRDTPGLSPQAIKFPDGNTPEHGQHAYAILELMQRGPFQYWKVRGIDTDLNRLNAQDLPEVSEATNRHQPVHTDNKQMRLVQGYFCITNQNIKNKHDERFFFVPSADKIPCPLTEQHKSFWRELVLNYREANSRTLNQRKENKNYEEYLGGDPGNTACSRHLYAEGAEELTEGTLCYVKVKPHGKSFQVEALYPVIIARELFDASPADCLDPSLHPAKSLAELSPADRLFGWVHQEKKDWDEREAGTGKEKQGAYAGRLKISPVACETPTTEAIETFGTPGLPLAILGQPRPQQARFYVGTNQGKAQASGLSTQDSGYAPGKQVRGRKVYPHHAGLPEHYWDKDKAHPSENAPDPTRENLNGHYREYRRVRQQRRDVRDDQNRSIQAWVKPGTRFRFSLEVSNLSKEELGALVWLFHLSDQHQAQHRLGGGKPLGFGSVTMRLVGVSLKDTAAWKSYYSTLFEAPKPQGVTIESPEDATLTECIQAFEKAVLSGYGGRSLTEVPFIAAYLKALAGFTKPIHYPRVKSSHQSAPVPPPEGELFKWFVQNNRGPRHALPDLPSDQGLPYLDDN